MTLFMECFTAFPLVTGIGRDGSIGEEVMQTVLNKHVEHKCRLLFGSSYVAPASVCVQDSWKDAACKVGLGFYLFLFLDVRVKSNFKIFI